MDGLFTAGPGGPRLGDLVFWIGTPVIFLGALGLNFLRSLGASILRRRFITQHGFTPCSDQTKNTAARLMRLPGDPQTRLAILQPVETMIGRASVTLLTLHRRGASGIHRDARLLLLRLPGQDFPPSLFCLRPGERERRSPWQRLQSAAFQLTGDRPDDLVPLESHRLLRSAGLLSAWGPRGAHLHTVIDPLLLEELLALGSQGVRIIRCQGEDCALEIPIGFDGDLEELWPSLVRIVRLSDDADPRRAAQAS